MDINKFFGGVVLGGLLTCLGAFCVLVVDNYNSNKRYMPDNSFFEGKILSRSVEGFGDFKLPVYKFDDNPYVLRKGSDGHSSLCLVSRTCDGKLTSAGCSMMPSGLQLYCLPINDKNYRGEDAKDISSSIK